MSTFNRHTIAPGENSFNEMYLHPEYTVIDKISLNSTKHIYRARSFKDRQKVLLKVFEDVDPKTNEGACLINECEMLGTLAFRGLPRLIRVETNCKRTVAVFQDIEAIALEEYLRHHPTNIDTSLKIAISITEVLEYLHSESTVHRNLSPSGFLINENTLDVTFIDFCFAAKLSSPHPKLDQPKYPKSALPYIAPEQTGRIDAEADIRSDLYSLGVILYELVTGKVPFEATDVLSIIHCHIAKKPLPPHINNPLCPSALSNIIIKLLAKSPEERYQSPFGLKVDLQHCLNQWTTTGKIDLFQVGQQDFSGKLQNPKRFYGRETEIAKLQQAFKLVSKAETEVVLIEGSSGIGKSSLVNQFKDLVLIQGGIFVNGKFSQFQRNIPYFGFIQAFKGFTDYILTKDSETVETWKERIADAMGVNGRVLTDVIPHLEVLIGRQPAVPELELNETENRFHFVFINFIKCIAGKDHPLVIFFDDLQWADTASSNLLKIILTDHDLQSILFIGAYRQNEMNGNSSFLASIEEIRKKGFHIDKINLCPLPYEIVREIVQETLGSDIQQREALVHLVYSRSQGNPFFINAFLKCLYSENILRYNFYTSKWTWDASNDSQLRITGDIVELMIGRIRKLPATAQELLKVAACLGYDFNVSLVKAVVQLTNEEISERLKCAHEENLIILTGENYHFTHDRIHQAAYSLIPDSEKKSAHYKIGNALLQNLDDQSFRDYIFEVTNQLNAGFESINQEERRQLAALNLKVGIKAKNSAAYKPSFDYLNIGISLLGPHGWKTDYELTLQLYTEGAESGFLSGATEQMEDWIEIVIKNATTVLDKVRVYEIRIRSFTAKHRLLDAVKTALDILKLLNLRFPPNPNKLHIILQLLRIQFALFGKPVEDLVNLPVIKNQYAEAASRILAIVGSAVYFAMPNLFPLFVCKVFILMIKYGTSPYSGAVCAGYGLIILAGTGNIDAGYRLGKVATQLSEKFEANSFRYQCVMMVNNFIIHWKESLKNTLEPLRKNYWNCLETGNTEFASYSAEIYCFFSFFCGKNLKELTKEMLHFMEEIQQLRQEIALNLHKIHLQTVLNFQEIREHPTVLTGRVHNEAEMLELYKLTKAETLLFDVYLYKLILSFIFERYGEATVNAAEARTRIQSVIGSPEIMIFYFYDTLTKISQADKYTGIQQKVLLLKIYRNIKTFEKFSSKAPLNYSHKLLLLKAEFCRVRGRYEKAGLLYDEAVREGLKNDYINDLALTCELAGKFYQSRNRDFISRHYLLKAYDLYNQWGADAKVMDMRRKHAYLFEESPDNPLTGSTVFNKQEDLQASNAATEWSSQQLDLHSILRASNVISSEIQLDRLLKKLVKIVIQNAGAQRGYLVLKKENGFCIEAKGSVDEEEVVIQSIPLAGNQSVPEAIIHFVYLTKENLVIENAVEHPNFGSEPIIQKNGSRSILCMPIVHQADVIGLLYLENKLITNAFTHDRTELLKLLSGQIAISLQNALNEQKKKNAVAEREKLLKEINKHQKELLKTKLEIQEQTFQNISQEIHDNIGQSLSLIKINMNTIDMNTPHAAIEKLADSKGLLSRVIQDLRDLSKCLSTDFINKVGLENAINQQLYLLQKTGSYSTQLILKGDAYKLSSQQELVIFRIVQELLNNIVKHADATSIKIIADYKTDKLEITVQDNGKGFQKEDQKFSGNKGMGLHNIQNRVSLLKGSITFLSEPQNGTIVILSLPR